MKASCMALSIVALSFLSVYAGQYDDGRNWQKAERVSEEKLSSRYHASAVTPSWIGGVKLRS